MCLSGDCYKPAKSNTVSVEAGKKAQGCLGIEFGGAFKTYPGSRLTAIPGLNVLAVLSLISEIGTNMAKWRNEKAFVSWMGLSPNNKVSGERALSSRTRKVNNRAATTLRLAAMLLGRTAPPRAVLPQETRPSRCSKGHHGNGTETRLSDLSAHQRRPSLPRTRSAHL